MTGYPDRIANFKRTVLIAYQHPLIAAGLTSIFRACEDFEVIDGRIACITRAASLIVADFDNGVMHATKPGQHPPVLILSHEDGEAAIREALDSGIRGYLLPGSSIESIVDSARTIVRGGTVIDPFIASRVLNSLNSAPVTRRELTVLGLLMRGMSDKAIANRLGITAGTIKCHLKHLRMKLDAGSRTEAILVAQRRGLLPRGDTASSLAR